MAYTLSTLHCDTPLREVAMPWLETDPMNERLKFVHDALSDRFTMKSARPLWRESADRLQMDCPLRRGGPTRAWGS